MARQLTDEERQYIAYKKTKEYQYAEPYLPVNAREQMGETELRREIRTVITEYLPEDERRELAEDLRRAREDLGLVDSPNDAAQRTFFRG